MGTSSIKGEGNRNVARKTIAVGCYLRVYTKQPTAWVITGLYLILLSYVINWPAFGSS
jgi:hypothetical protein